MQHSTYNLIALFFVFL